MAKKRLQLEYINITHSVFSTGTGRGLNTSACNLHRSMQRACMPLCHSFCGMQATSILCLCKLGKCRMAFKELRPWVLCTECIVVRYSSN